MTHLKSTLMVLTIVVGGSLLTSCKKEKAQEVTDEDAVELIEGSLQKNSAGLEETVAKYSEALVTDFAINDNCSQNYDTSYNFAYTGTLIQADYDITWGYSLNCNLGIPSSASLSATSSGTYSTNRTDSDDNTSANLSITGIEPGSSALNFSGNLSRSGTQVITINSNTREITSTITLTLSDLVVNKSTYEIESGTGTAQVSASNGSETYTFSGSIVFNGGGTATLTLNGNSYTINLN